MAGMVLVEEGDEVQQEVESAVHRLLPGHTTGPIPEPSNTHTGLNPTSSMIFHLYIYNLTIGLCLTYMHSF